MSNVELRVVFCKEIPKDTTPSGQAWAVKIAPPAGSPFSKWFEAAKEEVTRKSGLKCQGAYKSRKTDKEGTTFFLHVYP